MFNVSGGISHNQSTLNYINPKKRVCGNHFLHGKPMGDHSHTELWLRGYDTDKETQNCNVSRIIESLNDVHEQSDVFIST